MEDNEKERAELRADLDGAIASLREAQRLQAEHRFLRDEDLPPDLLEHIKETLRFMDEHGFGLLDPVQSGEAETPGATTQPDRHSAC